MCIVLCAIYSSYSECMAAMCIVLYVAVYSKCVAAMCSVLCTIYTVAPTWNVLRCYVHYSVYNIQHQSNVWICNAHSFCTIYQQAWAVLKQLTLETLAITFSSNVEAVCSAAASVLLSAVNALIGKDLRDVREADDTAVVPGKMDKWRLYFESNLDGEVLIFWGVSTSHGL